MRSTILIAFAMIACASAAPSLHRRELGCAPEDKTGGKLQQVRLLDEDGGGDLLCAYTTQACTYFPNNGNFSSGSSDCPGGLVEGGKTPGGGGGGGGAEAPPTTTPEAEPTPTPTPTPKVTPTPTPEPTPTPTPSKEPEVTTSQTPEEKPTTKETTKPETTTTPADPKPETTTTKSATPSSTVTVPSQSPSSAAMPLARGSGWALTVGAVILGAFAL